MRAEAGGVNRKIEARRLTLIAALLVIPAAVSAQRLTVDPTRPPAGYGMGAADGERDTAGGIRLQSILISPTHREAIINGMRVRLGAKFGDAVLVKVSESEVVLRSGAVQQVLRIHPGVEKRELPPVAPGVEAGALPGAKAQARSGLDANPPGEASAPAR
jgi:MSHA biogenesis protein MshK